MRGIGRVAPAAMAAVGLLAGCALPVSTTADPRRKQVVRAAPRCTRQDGSVNLHRRAGRLPEHLKAVAVVLCQREVRTRPDTSQWDFIITKRATTRLAPFISALREPDDPPPGGGVSCPAMAQVDPIVVVVDSTGVGYRPRFPRDGCDLLKPDAPKALNALPFRTVAAVPVQEVQSALSASSGCVDEWKDMLAIDGARAGQGGSPTAFSDRVLVCDYRIHPPQLVPPAGGFGRAVAGTLVAGRRLTGDQSSELLHDIGAAPAAPACSARHTRYVVLTGAGLSTPVYLELDGCRRLSSWTGGLRVVTSDIARLVDIG